MNSNGTDEPTKDLTENLSDRQLLLLLLERITGIDERATNDWQSLSQLLERVTGIDERVAGLEVAVEERKLETRPLWARLDGQVTQMIAKLLAIEEEQARMREEQRRMRFEIGTFSEDLRNERLARFYLVERMNAMESSQDSQQ